jgi:hypothetical protein
MFAVIRNLMTALLRFVFDRLEVSDRLIIKGSLTDEFIGPNTNIAWYRAEYYICLFGFCMRNVVLKH